jgi:uncharacterized protein (TIGR02996 family)
MPEEPELIDPEDLFWKPILEQPQSALPRLLYADWCDENDRPVMSLVQRWLAASGRVPMRWYNEIWYWGSEKSPPTYGIKKNHTLPEPLFRQLDLEAASNLIPASVELVSYRTQREAEEALVGAWVKATQKRWFRSAWKPDFTSADGFLKPPPKPTPPPVAPSPTDRAPSGFLLGTLYVLFVIAALFRGWTGGGSSSTATLPRFTYTPPSVQATNREIEEALKSLKPPEQALSFEEMKRSLDLMHNRAQMGGGGASSLRLFARPGIERKLPIASIEEILSRTEATDLQRERQRINQGLGNFGGRLDPIPDEPK